MLCYQYIVYIFMYAYKKGNQIAAHRMENGHLWIHYEVLVKDLIYMVIQF